MDNPKPKGGGKGRQRNGGSTPRSKNDSSEKTKKRGELEFSANFESGNLGQVKPAGDFEYDIFLRGDSNNSRYRVWFYFSVKNTKPRQKVIFNIVNFSKTKSLYRDGMSPLIKSTSRDYWERIPERNVYYYRCPRYNKHYVLSFAFEFDKPDDTYYFSYCYPYTYTDLQKYLYKLDSMNLPYYERSLLTRTVQGRRLDLIKVETPSQPTSKKRRVVFITARVHPGETPASFICEGFMEFILGQSSEAQVLRDNLTIYIVPMLNPDGVFLGNYRCSSMGYDLNREWLNPDAYIVPTVVAVKNFALKIHQNPNVDLDFFIDIHAHSTATNSFLFCNVSDDSRDNGDAAALPKILDSIASDFSMANTKFCKDPSKAGTGRRALADSLKHGPHCYTFEVSFFHALDSAMKSSPYTEKSYCELGKKIGLGFLEYYKLSRLVRRKSTVGPSQAPPKPNVVTATA